MDPFLARAAAATCLLVAGCASVAPTAMPPTDLPEVRPGYVAGYLQPDQLPDTAALLAPPPVAGSSALAADEEYSKIAVFPADSPRWLLAARDANITFPHATGTFACVLGMQISKEATPHLNMLLRRIRMDASRANDKLKDRYKRPRPFMVNKESSCVPNEDARYKADGYPSGHASIGWAWALALAELVPERANEILSRGYAFGNSRVICKMHYKSDVEAGRIVGAATISRLHAEPVFVAQMAEAKREIASARAAGSKVPQHCELEAKALGGK